MRDDPALQWLMENDPEAAGRSAEEYRRATGIESIAAERADIRRHLAEGLADEFFHCHDCADKARASRKTVA